MRWLKRLSRKVSRLFRKDSPNPIINVDVVIKLTVMFTTVSITEFVRATEVKVTRMKAAKSRYIAVARQFNMPWEVVAVIHSMEGNLSFKRILHNGERLPVKKTRLVPKGRGPFRTWEESAMDALRLKESIMPDTWTIGATLDFLERYNGLGYRKYHPEVNSPYLWSGTNHYTSGKYVADGKWSSTAVSKQIGCVPLLRGLGYLGEEE